MKENKTGIPGLYRMTVGEKEILFPDSSLSGIELSGFTTDFSRENDSSADGRDAIRIHGGVPFCHC